MKKPDTRHMTTNDGAHAAMRDYARQMAKPVLSVAVMFKDGSTMQDTFERGAITVNYRTPDGETYTQDIDGPMIRNTFMPGEWLLSQSEFKRAFATWLGDTVESIEWSKQ